MAATLTLSPPTKDSYVNQHLPGVNYGDVTLFRVRKKAPDYNYRSFLEFDISPIPAGAQILSAILKLWGCEQEGYPGQQVLNRVVGPWEEMTLRWDNQPPVSDLHALTLEVSAEINCWKEYDVTQMVQDARAIGETVGFRIKTLTEGGADQRLGYYSKEMRTQLPTLIITYAP